MLVAGLAVSGLAALECQKRKADVDCWKSATTGCCFALPLAARVFPDGDEALPEALQAMR